MRLTFFDKQTDQLTVEDVEWLESTEVKESQEIEFKRQLPGDKGGPDPWEIGAAKIGRPAVTALVKELVAFANSQGGYLVLGMKESEDKPARAAGISPVRDVLDLAERLKRTCRDNIEPSVHGFEVVGLPVGEGGEGVVVMRMPGSPYGPHRSRCDKECYIRKNDDSVPMSMDEIQRRVVEMSQRLDKVDQWFEMQRPKDFAGGWCIRAAARPLGPFHIPQLHQNRNAKPRIVPITVVHSEGRTYSAKMWAEGLNWRPVVRGTSCSDRMPNGSASIVSVFEDGSVVFDWRWPGPFEEKQKIMCMAWLVGTFGNLLLAVERLRQTAKSQVEYAAEVHLVNNGPLQRKPYWDSWPGMSTGIYVANSVTLGRYPISNASNFADITKLFETDASHLAGAENVGGTSFNFEPLLTAMKSEVCGI